MNLKTTGGGDSDYMMCNLKSPKLHKSSWIKLSDGLDRGGVILPHDHGSGVEWQLCLELLFLLVSILRRSVCWRQGQNLQGIEGILLSSNILLCIPDPSTIAVGVVMGGVRNTPITIHNFLLQSNGKWLTCAWCQDSVAVQKEPFSSPSEECESAPG